jgi:hypothetical protein
MMLNKVSTSTGAQLKMKQLITESQARMSEDDMEFEVSNINLHKPHDNLVKNFSQKYIKSGMGVVTGTDIMAVNNQAMNSDLDEGYRNSPNSFNQNQHFISQAYSILGRNSQLAPNISNIENSIKKVKVKQSELQSG